MSHLELIWMLIKLYMTIMFAAAGMASAVVVFNLLAAVWRNITQPAQQTGLQRKTSHT